MGKVNRTIIFQWKSARGWNIPILNWFWSNFTARRIPFLLRKIYFHAAMLRDRFSRKSISYFAKSDWWRTDIRWIRSNKDRPQGAQSYCVATFEFCFCVFVCCWWAAVIICWRWLFVVTIVKSHLVRSIRETNKNWKIMDHS